MAWIDLEALLVHSVIELANASLDLILELGDRGIPCLF